jgi:undecaprenyl diphosphate synthase
MQSTLRNDLNKDLHVALIMDGNGRWARAQDLPRTAGHRAGVETVRRIVEAAPGLGVGHLTLYAFSSDNWQRPPAEVRALMQLLRVHLPAEAARCREHGVRLHVIGRRDRLPAPLRQAIQAAEALTAGGHTLHLRLALDYSARDALVHAARLLPPDRPATRDALAHAYHADAPVPDVDLLIRTGGEQRLSDFLLWECAYAELYFTDCMWPDFDEAALAEALDAFHRRERRFGRVPTPV